MPAHTTAEFGAFMAQLKETNQSLDFFCDFEKIARNVDDVKLSLCMLNSLLGSSDLRRSVEAIWNRDRSAFRVLEILVAIRSSENKKFISSDGRCLPINSLFCSVDGVMEFLEGTGLADVFVNNQIGNLVDYVFGIETGLDTNARKNRSGHVMEGAVAQIMESHGLDYEQEVYSRDFPTLHAALGYDEKRFDFVVRRPGMTYLFEVNFYSGGGSKLNEVARAYSELAPRVNAVPGFRFVWITDGVGWRSARTKLEEAYSIIPDIYNLTNIHDFLDNI